MQKRRIVIILIAVIAAVIIYAVSLFVPKTKEYGFTAVLGVRYADGITEADKAAAVFADTAAVEISFTTTSVYNTYYDEGRVIINGVEYAVENSRPYPRSPLAVLKHELKYMAEVIGYEYDVFWFDIVHESGYTVTVVGRESGGNLQINVKSGDTLLCTYEAANTYMQNSEAYGHVSPDGRYALTARDDGQSSGLIEILDMKTGEVFTLPSENELENLLGGEMSYEHENGLVYKYVFFQFDGFGNGTAEVDIRLSSQKGDFIDAGTYTYDLDGRRIAKIEYTLKMEYYGGKLYGDRFIVDDDGLYTAKKSLKLADFPDFEQTYTEYDPDMQSVEIGFVNDDGEACSFTYYWNSPDICETVDMLPSDVLLVDVISKRGGVSLYRLGDVYYYKYFDAIANRNKILVLPVTGDFAAAAIENSGDVHFVSVINGRAQFTVYTTFTATPMLFDQPPSHYTVWENTPYGFVETEHDGAYVYTKDDFVYIVKDGELIK